MRKIILVIAILEFLSISNYTYCEDPGKIPGIPSLEIRDMSGLHFTKINIGITGKVNEVIIERKSENEENYKDVYSKKSDEPKEFQATEWYDEDIKPGKKYIYRIYSKLNSKQSPKSKGYEYKTSCYEDWYYPSRKAKAVQFSDMPRVDIKPNQVGYSVNRIITARLLPEEIFGKDTIYIKYIDNYTKEDARYGIYKKTSNDESKPLTPLWEDYMKEDFDTGWEYTGRFFLCDVTGDGVDELGLVLISGNLNLQRVYFFNIKGEFICIFKNRFNVNAYAEDGDYNYKIKAPKIFIGGDRLDPNVNRERDAVKVAPRMTYWKAYKYNPESKRFLLISAKEKYSK